MSQGFWWDVLREKRNAILEKTDKYMLSDFPIDTKLRNKYRDYRAYLRNLPKMYDESSITSAKIKNFEEWVDFMRSGDY